MSKRSNKRRRTRKQNDELIGLLSQVTSGWKQSANNVIQANDGGKTVAAEKRSFLKRVLAQLKRIPGYISALSVVVGLAVSYLTLYPKVSISVGQILNPDDPFETAFTISNEGSLPIYDVEFQCGLGFLQYRNGISIHEQTLKSQQPLTYGARFYSINDVASVIRSGQTATVVDFCLIRNSPPVEKADITFVVSFKLLGLFRRQNLFRLVLGKTKEGRLIWLQQPF